MNAHEEIASIIARISERAACGERRAGAKGLSRSLLAARCSAGGRMVRGPEGKSCRGRGEEMRIEEEEIA
jgi:hypothetical protein